MVVLKLRSCCLNELPDIPHLEEFDLNENAITTLDLECPNLRKLYIEKNPVCNLEIKRNLFPNLKELGAGSQELRFVSYESSLQNSKRGIESSNSTGYVPKYHTSTVEIFDTIDV